MEIVKLPHGERAPLDSDCISIDRRQGGGYELTGSALVGEESVAMIDSPRYETSEAAEAEGLAWANENKVQILYISTS